jgi:pyridoxamine 5'-phosphate oxidase
MTTPPQLANLRRDYQRAGLSETDADADPIQQFNRWFDEALTARLVEPNAMTLATVNPQTMQPSARIVLLKGLDERGFIFFTNYLSQKGVELAANPKAAIVFLWMELERQVRVEGTIEKTTRAESDNYFHQRPRASQVAASIGAQSEPVGSRAVLEEQQAVLEERFKGQEVPLPDFWGGYRLIPARVEFWQGRPSRLHDRLLYVRHGASWQRNRLSP